LVVAAWVAGHTRPATALRRALAPTLRTRPAATYFAAYLALLLVIIWGPTPATRQIAYIIGFIVLLGLGVHALRRQTAAEFPDVQAGDTMQSIRTWNAADRRHRGPAAAPVVAGANGGHVADLERLATLHDRGSLTDEEFAAEKAVLMDSP
jgi:Short C-terminal domain